jgi:hypothetical protein
MVRVRLRFHQQMFRVRFWVLVSLPNHWVIETNPHFKHYDRIRPEIDMVGRVSGLTLT